MRSSRGQATIEYVGALLLVGAILLSATVAVAAPGVPRAIVAKLRLALCIVAGDVCTSDDAAARGLAPCVVGSEEHATSTGLSLWVFRAGGRDVWSAQRRSDGTVVLSDSYGQSVTGTVGVQLGRAEAGSADIGAGFAKGRSWTLDGARFRRLLTVTKGDPRRFRLLLEGLLGDPDETYLEGAGDADVTLKPAGDGRARAVLGRRVGPEGTTYYVDLGAQSSGGLEGRVIAEYRDDVLTLRGTSPRRRGEETETVLSLPLRTATDRELARRIAFVDLADPSLALRDLAARARDHGTIERNRYRVREGGSSWDHGIQLGLAFGADHATSVLERTLVDAEVVSGALPARREDCLREAR